MTLDKDSTTARKAWFFFEDELVALGAGIASSDTHPVRTSLNQCHLQGAVTVDGTVQSKGEHTLENAHWVHHDGFVYVIPDKGTLHLENDKRTGNWHQINNTKSASEVTLDVFTLWLEHGIKPTGAKYSYVVAPSAKPDDARAYADVLPVRELENSTARQGVRHDGHKVAGVVFHEAGSLALHPALEVRVDEPCIVIVDESKAAPEVTVADPSAKLSSIRVTLIRTGMDDEVLSFELPGGDEAGKSVMRIGNGVEGGLSDGGADARDVDAGAEDSGDAAVMDSIGADGRSGVGGSTSTDGTLPGNVDTPEESSCGCRVAEGQEGSFEILATLLALMGLLGRSLSQIGPPRGRQESR